MPKFEKTFKMCIKICSKLLFSATSFNMSCLALGVGKGIDITY